MPNPFNPTTTINLALPRESHVRFDVYSPNGQLLRTLLNKQIAAGYHKVVWNGFGNNGKNLASGIYLYKITVGGKVFNKKMLLIK
jgi:flagellar hook assembly protein FlgD